MTITSDTTLTEDHVGSIEIAADDITLDCAGFSLIGPSPDTWPVDGVLVDQRSGVTIKNCVASGFVNGFKLQGVTDSTLVGNTATVNEGNGFYADGSEGNVFRDNVSFANIVGTGFAFLSASNDNLLRDSIAFGNGGNGANVYRADGNRFRGNVVYGNGAFGFAIDRADGSRLVENVARGNTGAGFALSASRGSRLVRNVARGNGDAGFSAFRSSNMTLRGNSAVDNYYGVNLGRADKNVLTGNIARGNVDNGFGLCQSSSGNVLRGNQSLRNGRGFFLCRASHDNVFRLNRANRNEGAGFGTEASDGNQFKGNRAMDNGREGFYLLFGASYNTVRRNVACRNGIDAYDDGTGVGNIWRANRFCTSDI